MKLINLALLAVVFQSTVTNALDNTNSTLYSFHFLGINGTDASSNVGYLQTYNGQQYYAYNSNSLCVLTARNSSGSITKFDVSNDFGKCPDFASGALTELTSHSDGYYLNANNGDQWHLTWFTTLGEDYSDDYSEFNDRSLSNQYWRVNGDCADTKTINESSQTWGPMSQIMYRDQINATCYLIKADPLDKATPTGILLPSQESTVYGWTRPQSSYWDGPDLVQEVKASFVESWYVIDPFPGSCPYYSYDGWRSFNVELSSYDRVPCELNSWCDSADLQYYTWENVKEYLRDSNNGPGGVKMSAFATQKADSYRPLKHWLTRIGCYEIASYLSTAAISVALALASFTY